MEQEMVTVLLERQANYFAQGRTRAVQTRLHALWRLLKTIQAMEPEISHALKVDLGKSDTESYLSEIGLVQAEIRYMLRNLPQLAKPRRVKTPLAQWAARSFIQPSPYGTVLIMSPWNYPFLLALTPAIDALAAGNTVVIKPSAYAPATSEVVQKLITRCLPPELAYVVTGGREENQTLLDSPFDSIFFTGGTEVGRLVLEKAAARLTPVTLELGGKSPCIVDQTAHLSLAARRIVFGKFLNCGQTCVAPDYLYVEESIHDQFLEALKREITVQFGAAPLQNPKYGKIINQKHFERLCGLMDADKLVWGGQRESDALRIAPTILDRVSWDDPVMREEIFGPILPILTFKTIDEVLEAIAARAHPLALYCFSRDKAVQKKVMTQAQYGGGCINDTVIHLATSQMGFGGVGGSGMGAYHGKAGFDTFTHYKSIVDKKNWIDLPMRYQPYTKRKDRMIRRFLK